MTTSSTSPRWWRRSTGSPTGSNGIDAGQRDFVRGGRRARCGGRVRQSQSASRPPGAAGSARSTPRWPIPRQPHQNQEPLPARRALHPSHQAVLAYVPCAPGHGGCPHASTNHKDRSTSPSSALMLSCGSETDCDCTRSSWWFRPLGGLRVVESPVKIELVASPPEFPAAWTSSAAPVGMVTGRCRGHMAPTVVSCGHWPRWPERPPRSVRTTRLGGAATSSRVQRRLMCPRRAYARDVGDRLPARLRKLTRRSVADYEAIRDTWPPWRRETGVASVRDAHPSRSPHRAPVTPLGRRE